MATPRTVTISLPPELARKVDRAARAEGRTRSELFREAIRQYLERQERWDQIFELGEERAKALRLRDEDVARIVEELRHSSSR
jgi:CopG family transcriptional regulator/antitoxin EndoAI